MEDPENLGGVRDERRRKNSWHGGTAIVYDPVTSSIRRLPRDGLIDRRENYEQLFSTSPRFRVPVWINCRRSPITCQHLRSLNYFLMLYASFTTLGAGKAAETRESWDSVFLLSYIVWGVSASISLIWDFRCTVSPLVNGFSHIGCCAATIYFFSSVLHVASSTLPIIIPICVNLGLLASLGLQRIPPEMKDTVLGYVASCLGMQYSSTRVEVVLPLTERPTRSENSTV